MNGVLTAVSTKKVAEMTVDARLNVLRNKPAAPPDTLANPLVFESPFGWIGLAADHGQIVRVVFGHRSYQSLQSHLPTSRLGVTDETAEMLQDLRERLLTFTTGTLDDFQDVPVSLTHLTGFQRRVLQACRQIPVGQTRSYGQLAQQAGSPRAARAVGTVMANNHVPLIIPCHRVIAAGGKLGGFSAPTGTRLKRRLQRLEQEMVANA